MENTLENKAKFFARYYLQEVYNNSNYPDQKPNQKLDNTLLSYTDTSEFLMLKSISKITDDDANNISIYGEYAKKNKGFKVNGYDTPQGFVPYAMPSVDYLRSKGYALPFMELSVDKLIEYKWIKLG